MTCSHCGASLGSQARFCSRCGGAVATADGAASARAATEISLPARQDLVVIDDHVVWNLHPGHVARKLTPAAIEALPRARGIAIHDGTRALVFTNGRLAADLVSGVFEFDRPQAPRPLAAPLASERRGFFAFLNQRGNGGGSAGKSAVTSPTATDDDDPPAGESGRSPLVEVVLIRQGSLPLVVTLREVRTATVTTTVVLQFMIEIVDPVAFSRMLMQVRSELGLNALAIGLMGIVESALRQAFQHLPAEQIAPDPVLESRLASTLTGALGEDWGFLRVIRVAKVTAHRHELARLHEIGDATYLSDRALHQASVRSEFANRLREQRNRQRIDEAAGVQQLHAELQRINRDGLVSQDDLAQFESMLEHGRRLRDAQTEEEYQEALGGFRKNELIREDSVTALARKLANDQADRTRQRTHALAVFDLSQQLEMDQARLQWEHDIGDKRIALELDRRLRDHLSQYELAAVQRQRQRQDDDYADERRRAEQAHDHRERLSQLELARQAQSLSDRRQQEEHHRSQETAAQRARDEQGRLVAEAQRWSGMTAEQIMAANPALTPAAAAALASKYTAESAALAEKAKAEAATTGGEHRARAAEQAKGELREFMTNQLATIQELVRHTLEANAQIASAFAGGRQREEAAPAKAAEPSQSYCSRCGRRLEAGTCPVCSPSAVS